MDQNKFINTYIDVIINSLLEYVKANLQLQTQVKTSESVIAEKDQIIESLNEQLKTNHVADDWKKRYEAAEVNYSAAMNKLKHMDALLAQVAEMKSMIIKLQNKSPKKVINTKSKVVEEIAVLPTVENTQQKETDDF